LFYDANAFYHTAAILEKPIVFDPLASIENSSQRGGRTMDFIVLGLKMAARDKSLSANQN
jgi:hypothetical protein